LARSPEAPKSTTVHGSEPFVPPERFSSMVVGLPSARFQALIVN
jgi:hypothetical protein